MVNKAIVDEAYRLHDLGYDIIPVGVDGADGFNLKNPGIVPNWYEHEWTQKEMGRALLADERRGLGVRLSVNALIDIETDTQESSENAEKLFAFYGKVTGREFDPPAWHRVDRTDESHFPGVHRLYRLNTTQILTLSELRKLGGFKSASGIEVRCKGQSVIPPAGGREWLTIPYLASEIPVLPQKIFDTLIRGIERPAEGRGGDGVTDSPGYDFCQKGDWSDILVPHGWQINGCHVTRPGKSYGVSGTVGVLKSETRGDLLFVFSEDAAVAPLEPHRTYSKFEAYAALRFNGDYSAAARDLRIRGYGVARSAASMFEPIENHIESDTIPKNQVSTSITPVENPVEDEPSVPQTLARLEDRFYDNPVGEYCMMLREFSNIDTQAVYFQALEMIGALCGRHVYYRYNLNPRYLVDYLIVTGATGSGKGTTFDAAKALFKPVCSNNCFQNGHYFEQAYVAINRGRFGSSEGLLAELAGRDAALDCEGFSLGSQYWGTLLVTDQEASAAFAKMFYDTSILNETLRQAWDFNTLSNRTKNSTIIAKNPLLGLIWHIVPSDISKLPTHLIQGGFINRLKIIACEKPTAPPRIQAGIALQEYKKRVFTALEPIAEDAREWVFSPGANELLESVAVKQHAFEGLVAATHERYTAHVERQAVRLAVLQGRQGIVTESDVEASTAMQEIVFGHTEVMISDMRGQDEDATLERRLLEYVSDCIAPPSKSDITRHVLGNNSARIPVRDRILKKLVRTGVLVQGSRPQSNGRPAQVYWRDTTR